MRLSARQLRSLVESEVERRFRHDEEDDEFHGEDMTREEVMDALRELLDHMEENEDYMPHPGFLRELGEVSEGDEDHEYPEDKDAEEDEEDDEDEDAEDEEEEDEDEGDLNERSGMSPEETAARSGAR
jgi:hypothetical protein